MTRYAALFAVALVAGCGGSAGSRAALGPLESESLAAPVHATGSLNPYSAVPTFSATDVHAMDHAAGHRSCHQAPCIYATAVQALRHERVSSHVLVWSATANGNVGPRRDITGADTQESLPNGIAVDRNHNMYVLDEGTSAITEYAPGANGDAIPVAVIRGPDTGIEIPVGIAVDDAGNIYVANSYPSLSGQITVYPAGSNGDVKPMQLIIGSNTGLVIPQGIAVDKNRNIYITNWRSSVLVFAAGATGNVFPIQSISGSNTGLEYCYGLALDAKGELYVANVPPSTITVYAPGANGNVTPIRTIAGSATRLAEPYGVAIDVKGNLYVLNNSSKEIDVFDPSANGDVSPIRSIVGGRTKLGRGNTGDMGIAVR